jgi:hypothetical protein
VGSGQWAAGSFDLVTAHRQSPTARFFRSSLYVASRRPETMKKRGAGFQPAHEIVVHYAGARSAARQVGNLPHAFSEETICSRSAGFS